MVFIQIRYGPYLSSGIIAHRIQKLHGLISALTELSYLIEIIPTSHLNRMTIEMMDMEVFRCDIRYFLFNVDSELDVTCKKAIRAVKEGTRLLCNDKNVGYFASIEEGMRLYQIGYVDKNARKSIDEDVQIIYEIGRKLTPIIEDNFEPCRLQEN